MQYTVLTGLSIAVLEYYVCLECADIIARQKKNNICTNLMTFVLCVLLGMITFETDNMYLVFPLTQCAIICVLTAFNSVDIKENRKQIIQRLLILLSASVSGYFMIYVIMKVTNEEDIFFIIFLIVECVVVKAYKTITGSAYPMKISIILMCPIIFMSIIVFIISSADIEYYKRMLLLIAVIMAVIFSFTAINVLVKQFEDKTEEKLLDKQNELYRQQIEYMLQSDESMRIVRHDMKNHIIAVKNIIEKKEYELLDKYIDKISENICLGTEEVNTGNLEFDAVLNSKISTMKRFGIQFKKSIVIPDDVRISGYDMAVIAGNVLDNSIRAVQDLEDDRRWINFNVRYLKNTLYINVSNPYNKSIVFGENSMPVTTKADTNRHGIGLKSVAKTVEKYDGKMFLNTDNNRFAINIEMTI